MSTKYELKNLDDRKDEPAEGHFRNDRARCAQHLESDQGPGRLHLRPRLHGHGKHRQQNHLHRRRRRACCCTAAIRSNSWRRSRAFSKSPRCSSTASCRPRRNSTHSRIRSCATPWSTSSCCGFSRVSTTMRTRWRWSRRWLRRWPRSITTPRTSAIRGIAKSLPTGSSQNCRPSPPLPTSTRSASRSSIRATICAIARTCSTCSSPFPASRMRSIRSLPKRSICCSYCTRITNKTPAPRPCGSPAAPARIPTPPFPPACPRCGDRRTAARMKRSSTCWTASARSPTSTNSWRA